MVRVAFQGELGAFSEEALRELFRGAATPWPCREFADVGEAVRDGLAEFGLLPIENSLAGSVIPSYDVLAGFDLRVVGETVLPIHHCVMAVPGAAAEGLTRVLSHPVALAQCTRFLRARPALEAVAVYDTAGAAREIASRADPAVAAIAGRGAAERYGLEILWENVEDRPDNQTRFLLVTRTDQTLAAPVPDGTPGFKSLLLIETENRPGALVRILVPFAEHGINLSKIESRPGAEPWTYRFFLEVEADWSSPASRPLVEAMTRTGPVRLELLGSFPRWTPQRGDERRAGGGPVG